MCGLHLLNLRMVLEARLPGKLSPFRLRVNDYRCTVHIPQLLIRGNCSFTLQASGLWAELQLRAHNTWRDDGDGVTTIPPLPGMALGAPVHFWECQRTLHIGALASFSSESIRCLISETNPIPVSTYPQRRKPFALQNRKLLGQFEMTHISSGIL